MEAGVLVGLGDLVGLGVAVGEPEGVADSCGVEVSKVVGVGGVCFCLPSQKTKPPTIARRATTIAMITVLSGPEEGDVSLEVGVDVVSFSSMRQYYNKIFY